MYLSKQPYVSSYKFDSRLSRIDKYKLWECHKKKENLAGKPIEMKFTSFQNVSTLSVFVKENATGDENETTCLSKLVVLGFTTAGDI